MNAETIDAGGAAPPAGVSTLNQSTLNAQEDSTKSNQFKRFWDLGYKRLCPIAPFNAKLNPESSLAKRMAKNPRADARGKAPSVLTEKGWQGCDFLRLDASEVDLDEWHRWGAGVGLILGRGLYAIDADALVESHAAIIRAEIERMFGKLPVRVGRAPKFACLFRSGADIPYMRLDFGDRRPDGTCDRVEILGEGRQIVVAGVHPTTRKLYSWPDGVPALADVPLLGGL